jgi:hypothetical protein
VIPRLQERDVATLLGLAALVALTISLGVDPRLAGEIGAVLGLLLLVGVALRAQLTETRPRGDPPHEDAVTAARRSVDLALTGPWGVEGAFRRTVRDATAAHLALQGRELDAATIATLPPDLAALLAAARRT